ncbi:MULTISPECIES: 16S rRNA (guanine(527)-N(7))-methyltransferase RsmG [unclassified Caballeronia]|uniref:16S rRNA (guanine(527)-N(7))-methyltransferase RsmG n=1 Tax=unclassified Caballeronia TaxID=2646786 RepID=UPI0028629D5F|nr:MULTISPECIES: 16S rRNA (guanine(527)-N(7))-methyltransferase RsmG [unclassified Caballeronia]MDR5737123.1 16S rRNA (guanine(527)-N(7))-methyltransferase RsmG [Caballeronia sp. LZ016]MDR5810348.1 16S rRNA (guanine(527)-N(7))-methyltransferase RsmG [Caballeronia sp. LZ019]
MTDLASMLDDGASQLGIALSTGQKQQLLDYVALLAKWNAVYNLTAIRDPKQMMIQHILDSLAIVPAIQRRNASTVLDVGSGGGLPGIVIAIALPNVRVTLNDIVHKKTAFQSQAKAHLSLVNLSVVTGRVESLTPGVEIPGKFDAIVSRAFAELADFVTLCRHLVADNGRILAMKGIRPDAEIARLPVGATVAGIERLTVPKLDAERHLVEVAFDA